MNAIIVFLGTQQHSDYNGMLNCTHSSEYLLIATVKWVELQGTCAKF